MIHARKVTEALLETVSAMADGHALFEDNDVKELTFGEITQSLPPPASAFSQLTLPVKVDGENFVVVAYKVAN